MNRQAGGACAGFFRKSLTLCYRTHLLCCLYSSAMSSNKSRRPPLASSLLWYLPVLALIVIAIYLVHPLVLIPLLLANTLAMAAVCHAIGFGPEPSFMRTALRRGAAWLVLFTAYTALVWLLVALPMISLTTGSSLGGVLMLSLALAVALAFLWRTWPAFGLIFLWDDAFPQSGNGSWIFTALTRSLTFARHLAAEERFFSQFLPSALCTLLLSAGALMLSGMYGVLPSELRTAGLWLYGLVVMPTSCLIMANRMLRALLLERRERQTASSGHDHDGPGSPRERSRGLADAPQTSPQDIPPGVRGQALLEAARDGNMAQALDLLEAGADANTLPDADDPDQRTLLTLAALHPDTRLLRALIAHGAEINHVHRGVTALLAVARDGCMSRAEAVMVLLANGADVDATDGEGNTALHHAARHTDLAVAADLIDAEAAPNPVNHHGLTPLAVACRAANWKMAGWLLQHGAKPQIDESEPALVAAAGIADDDPAGTRLLLERKARVNAATAQGRTALMTASLEGHTLIAQCLLDARADTAVADRHGITALMEAARHGATDIVHALIDAGADISPRDRHGRDALILACLSSRASAATVSALIDAGADPHAGDADGQSALDCATSAGRRDLVAILDPSAQWPADAAAPPAPDPEAATPEHLLDALRFGHWNIVGDFSGQVRDWPPATLAGLYLELADAEHARARRWLLDHGLQVNARLDDGRLLFTALVDALPASLPALDSLTAAGVSPAGAGRLARAMQALATAPETGVPLIMDMLRAGADPFGPLGNGRTPLHLATAPGWQTVLDTLLEAGCNPDVRDHDGQTPLHAALEHADPSPDTIRALIAAGADPELSHANGETPLGLVMNMDRPELLAWLRWGPWALPHRRLQAGDLAHAADAGDPDAVDKLLQLGFAVDSPGPHGASALVYACGRGQRDVASRLLDADADPAFASPDGITPLVAAINMHQLDMISLLLERGADVDQRLPGGINALAVACGQGHADAAKVLIAAGASIDATDEQGRTPLNIAAQYGFASNDSLRCRRLLDVLLDAGANPNQVDNASLTPLLMLLGAQTKPGTECDPTHLGALLPVLLDAGARHDHADPRGVTALHACAMHALLAPARILLARGADRSAVDAFGRRSADVARQLGYTDVAVELDERRSGIPSVHQTLRTPAQPSD